MWSVPVVHCAHAYALAVEGPLLAPTPAEPAAGAAETAAVGPSGAAPPRPWKVVYSGDTRPCDSLIKARRALFLLLSPAPSLPSSPRSAAQTRPHPLTPPHTTPGGGGGVGADPRGHL